MKKKHLFALTMLLCILLPFSIAWADEPPLSCNSCGNTDLEWFTLASSDGKDMHARFCEPCYAMVGASEPCEPIPGSATCTSPERCKVCGFRMTTSLSPNPDAHAWGTPQYTWNYLGDGPEEGVPSLACTAIRICTNYCGTAQRETVDASYTITAPSTCYTYGMATFTASFEANWAEAQFNEQLIGALADHTKVTNKAVDPTCTDNGLTEGVYCSVCGKTLVAQEVIPAEGHSYEATTVAPTCMKNGHTKHICTVCSDTYTENTTNALVHWYDLWIPTQDGAHSAECKRYGCHYAGTAECTLYEVTMMDGESEVIQTVCPVCGAFKETFFEAILESNISAIQTNALPCGEQIVRGMDAPCAGLLYAFTAAYESAGKIEPFNGIVSVTLPLDAEEYTEFKLVRVDVTPATSSTQRTEIWTDISFVFEDNKLTFETDTAGLFLLIPPQ